MVQTCVLIASALFIFTNLIVDVLYAYIDPRIKYQ
jgi:ABC-type dipeptide/oligopeptide/nickel transport system permease component